MTDLAAFNRIVKHVYTEPKLVAVVEFMRDYPSPIQQMLGQVGSRPASYADEDVRAWLESVADVEVSVTLPPERPDFDWWEPRHDQPWRRQAARDRELALS